MKRTALRQRSKKAQRIAPQRRKRVEEMLEDAVCAARLAGCTGRATEVHEPRMRSRGADILDPEQCIPICHWCHRWTHDNPAKAHELGLLLHSWEAH